MQKALEDQQMIGLHWQRRWSDRQDRSAFYHSGITCLVSLLGHFQSNSPSWMEHSQLGGPGVEARGTGGGRPRLWLAQDSSSRCVGCRFYNDKRANLYGLVWILLLFLFCFLWWCNPHLAFVFPLSPMHRLTFYAGKRWLPMHLSRIWFCDKFPRNFSEMMI